VAAARSRGNWPASPRSQAGPRWWALVALGLAGYAVNPVGYNLGLTVLDASWVGVLLGVNNSLQVLAWGALLVGERPTRTQLVGIGAGVGGVVLFEGPAAGPGGAAAVFPTLSVLAAGIGYGLWVVGTRALMRHAHPVDLACPSMLVGAVPTLVVGLAIEGLPHLGWSAWLWIVGLALVNTAVAFTVWTHTQRVLAAYESAVINNTMTVQVALLAFVFLDEPLGTRQWVATAVVAAATLQAQLAGRRRTALGHGGGQGQHRHGRRAAHR
jgi:drug/metabolite transporter (DMT)-like permease